MIQKVIIHQSYLTKKVRHDIDQIVTIMIIGSTIYYIGKVQFNHNITANLSIDLLHEIL